MKWTFFLMGAVLCCIGMVSNVKASDFSIFNTIDETVFVTPTKSATSIHLSPNSVSRFLSDDLFYLGIETVPDALRLVPGMIVSDLHGSNTQAGYHGLAVSIPRRMDVLYNTSSIYRPGYAGLHWRRLPVSIDDLSAIEVIRGSATTDFGSNALTGAVNLIQNSTTTGSASTISARVGSGDELRVNASSQYDTDTSSIFGRVFFEKFDGYDFTRRTQEYNDEFDGKGVLLKGEYLLDKNRILDWNVLYSDYTFTAPSFNFIGNGVVDEQAQDSVSSIRPAAETNIHAGIKLSGGNKLLNKSTNWNIGVQYSKYEREQELVFCNVQGSFDPLFIALDASPNVRIDAADFPLMIQSGLTTGVVQLDRSIVAPLDSNDQQILSDLGQLLRQVGPNNILAEICGLASLDTKEERYNFNGRIQMELSDAIMMSGDLNYIRTESDSKTYFQGEVSRDTIQLSINTLFNPNDDISLNIGVMLETDDYIDNVLMSPRISYNNKLSDDSSVRVLYSRSKRSPDLHETDRKWQFEVDFFGEQTDYFGRSSGKTFRVAGTDRELEEEILESFEVGISFAKFEQPYSLDVKLFYEDFENLISEPFDYLEFNLSNSGSITKKGIEGAWTYKKDAWKFGVNYTYLDWTTDTSFEETLIAKHIGSAWSIYTLPWAGKLAFTYSGFSGGNNGAFDKFDVTYSHIVNLYDSDFVFQVGVKRYPTYTDTFTEFSSNDPVSIAFNDRNRIFGKIKYSF